jgi:hypothetical protein
MINRENLKEWGQDLKKILGSNVKFITCPEYERIGKSFKCPNCQETIGLSEIVTPSRKLAPINRGSEKSSKTPPLLNIEDVRGILLMGTINTIVGIVGLVYRSAWAFCLLVGVPGLVVALMAYKDYKLERAERLGWISRIATMTAYVFLALTAVGFLAITLRLLPIFAMMVVYLLVVNLVFVVPIFGALWSPGKYGGYTLLPQPLVWAVRICLALIGLILLFVWVFLR